MGRKPMYQDEDVVVLCARSAETSLRAKSERRAVINALIDAGGRMSLGAIDEHFGYDIRKTVVSLVRDGWLAIAMEDQQ